jgi:hypothetical protein
MKSTLVKTLAAAGLAFGLAVSPAAADGWGHGGYHHEGGWGHGWRHGDGDWGATAAAGVIGGLALGALATQGAYQPSYYPAPCRIVDEPVFDPYGEVVDYRRIRLCD